MNTREDTDISLEIANNTKTPLVSTPSIIKHTYYYKIYIVVTFSLLIVIEIGMILLWTLFEFPNVQELLKILSPIWGFLAIIGTGIRPYALRVIIDNENKTVTFKGRTMLCLCCHFNGYPNFTCNIDEIVSFNAGEREVESKSKGERGSYLVYILDLKTKTTREELVSAYTILCCGLGLEKMAEALKNSIIPN